MSTVNTVCTVMSGMSKDDVKAVVDHGLKLLGGNPAAARAKTKRSWKGKSPVTMKLATSVKPDAKNFYGVEGEWANPKDIKPKADNTHESECYVGVCTNRSGDKGYFIATTLTEDDWDGVMVVLDTEDGKVELPYCEVELFNSMQELAKEWNA